MRWSERQLAMLREMGIRVWARESPAEATAALEAGDEIRVSERAVDPARAPVARAPATAYERSPAPPSLAVASPAGLAAPGVLISADWLVVGEPFAVPGVADAAAAAEQELLLDNMLHAIRVSRRASGREGRACHLPLADGGSAVLDEAMEQVQPRSILALGRAAAAALLGIDEPLGKLRERVHQRDGVPVIVTFALPYLLRHSADKGKAWADLCRAVAAIA